RLRVTTTSDWTKVGLGGVPLTNLVVTTSAPGSTTRTDLSQGFVLLSQPLPRAESGGSVEATVDVFPARAGRRLTVTIGRGSIGATTVAVTRVDRRRSTALGSFTRAGVDGTDANEQSYVVPLR
ncbi:hypothetical protein, partial [Nocardioides sp.]|uniref:hypothetical protein n=1 Tax=Nocardioides sp. TaxID=35761 RepID=UPI003527FCBA